MIENDFPVLRETIRESAIGRATSWLAGALTTAAADAAVTKRLASARLLVEGDPTAVIRMAGVAVAVAALAAWGLSKFIPPYVSTAIPGAAFAAVATVSAIVALRSEAVADQWRASRLRRLIS
jgi:hypothetical protein